MTDQPKTTGLNERDVELIQRTFSIEDETLLKAMRALFLGFPVSAEQKQLIKSTFADPALRRVIQRKFYPQIDPDEDIGKIQDAWLGVEEMVFGHNPTQIEQALQYKSGALDLTRTALKLLDDPDGPRPDISIKINPMADPLGISLLVRNQYVRHVEQQLVFLKIVAGSPKVALTSKEKQKKEKDINKDSTE